MLHPQHHQQMNLARAQSEEFITPFPPLWQDRGITPLPPTPNGIILPACPSPAQPFVAPSPLPQYDRVPLQYDPRGFYMQNLPNAMFRPIETQTRASGASIADSQEGASFGEGYSESSNDHMQPQKLVQQQQHPAMGQGVYALQGMYHNKPYHVAQPGSHLMLPQQRSQFGASSAPTSPRLQHHGFNPVAMSSGGSEDHQASSSNRRPNTLDRPMNKRWSVPSMTPGNHSPIPPSFIMQHGNMNTNTAPKHPFTNKSDNSAYTKTGHQDSWVNHEANSTLNNSVTTTSGHKPQSVSYAGYKTTHHASGNNPWANPLMEETEDQALVPDAAPTLIDLIKGLDIADQHIESLQVSLCTTISMKGFLPCKSHNWFTVHTFRRITCIISSEMLLTCYIIVKFTVYLASVFITTDNAAWWIHSQQLHTYTDILREISCTYFQELHLKLYNMCVYVLHLLFICLQSCKMTIY